MAASKPFRIAGAETRDDQGRYAQRYKQPSAVEVIRRSAAEGTEVLTLLSEPKYQAPDHPSVGGQAGAQQNPWPAAAAPKQLPFRLKP
jgi:hypothetical protein